MVKTVDAKTLQREMVTVTAITNAHMASPVVLTTATMERALSSTVLMTAATTLKKCQQVAASHKLPKKSMTMA
jgi:hypothetical protein